MPVVKVWCLPSYLTKEDLKILHGTIAASVEAIPELDLEGKDEVSVLFPPDMLSYGPGMEVIVEVSGLFTKPERTREVRQRLAKSIGMEIKNLLSNVMVECFVTSFNPVDGFWTSREN